MGEGAKTTKNILEYLEANEHSKINCLDIDQKFIFASNLSKKKVVKLISEGADIRGKFDNGNELKYPFFVHYDTDSEKLRADNFNISEGDLDCHPVADIPQWDISERLQKWRFEQNRSNLAELESELKETILKKEAAEKEAIEVAKEVEAEEKAKAEKIAEEAKETPPAEVVSEEKTPQDVTETVKDTETIE
jgi:hypothetical protein